MPPFVLAVVDGVLLGSSAPATGGTLQGDSKTFSFNQITKIND